MQGVTKLYFVLKAKKIFIGYNTVHWDHRKQLERAVRVINCYFI